MFDEMNSSKSNTLDKLIAYLPKVIDRTYYVIEIASELPGIAYFICKHGVVKTYHQVNKQTVNYFLPKQNSKNNHKP